MKVLYGRQTRFAPSNGTSARARPKVTIGTFDGVHLGHQHVLQQLVTWARATESEAMVITFDRRPRQTLEHTDPEHLTSLRHRLLLFERQQIDVVLVLVFDQALAACEPEDFVTEIIIDTLAADGVLLGHDTRFGRQGRGDTDLMLRLGAELGFTVCSVQVMQVDGAPVSSTRVRAAVKAGDLELAARLLGRPVGTLATVVRGTGRGKSFGYPTANLDLHHEARLPEGVYATRAGIHGKWMDSVTNIGRQPDFSSAVSAWISDEIVTETYLCDFSEDLYGKEIEVRFLARIRPQRAFTSAEALIKRIEADVEAARQFHALDKDSPEPIT